MRHQPYRTNTIAYGLRAGLIISLVVGFGLTPALAAADSGHDGWSIRAIGGFGWAADTDFGGSGAGDLAFDAGFSAGAGVGYQQGRWRFSGEYLYQTNDTDSFQGTGLPLGASAGDFSAVVVSANAAAVFNLFGSKRATSYAGAGLVWLQELDLDFNTAAGEISFSSDDIGFQLFAGVDYQLGERWTLGAELRYLRADDIGLAGEGAASGSLTVDYVRTSALVSLGYRF